VTTFGYDASDQLTSEVRDNSHSTGYSLSYTYDHNHNRAGKTQAGVTTPYAYDAHDKLTSAGSKTYGYDLNGNCTSVTVGSSVTGLTYDVENRVTGITYPGGATNTFAYNGEDLRTKKVDSAGTKNYVTDGASPASAVLSDGAAVYTPGLSERRGTTSKFYHADALGSTRGITDSTQATTDAQLYDAFGMSVSRTGTTPTPFGFVGKSQYQTDGDSGLQLLGHRYYDPSIGRFLSQDPIQDGTNWYAYVDNNPLMGIDPLGLSEESGWNKFWHFVKEVLDENARQGNQIGPGTGDYPNQPITPHGNPDDPNPHHDHGPPLVAPRWPNPTIVKERNVTVRHNYHDPLQGTQDDHGPAHAHVTGGGGVEVRIGPKGNPLKGDPPLSPVQKAVVDKNRKVIRKTLNKLGRLLK
jgi:RHS repeat-associated protein